MTKVMIEPGICGLVTAVEVQADADDETELTVKVRSGCESVRNMMKELGNTYDAYEVCLRKPGEGPFYEYAQTHFPVHAFCPVLNGIIKAMEVEAKLALKKDVSIRFMETEQ